MFSKTIVLFAGLTLMASAASAAQHPAVKAAPQEKTYCLQLEATTGTRIGHTECRTKKEWAALGIDVDELLAK